MVYLRCVLTLPEPKVRGKRFTKKSFPIDYRQTVAEVFAEATRCVIRRMGSYEMLLRLRQPNRFKNFDVPIWSIDWTQPVIRESDTKIRYLKSSASFADSLLLPAPLSGPVLTVGGYFLGNLQQDNAPDGGQCT